MGLRRSSHWGSAFAAAAATAAIVGTSSISEVTASHDNWPSSSSDPSFVYSQSLTFQLEDHNYIPDKHNTSSSSSSSKDDTNETTEKRSPDHPVRPDTDNSKPGDFRIVYNQPEHPNEEQPSHTPRSDNPNHPRWVSRVEKEVHTDAFSFESSIFDTRMWSQEELEKRMEEETDPEDDDDDDDNDGSCSMLSNASLSRARITTHEEPIHRFTKLRGGEAAAQSYRRRSSSYPSKDTLVLLRGGAGTGSTTGSVQSVGSEVLQRLFVSALVTLLYEASLGHILEFLKIVMQTSSTKTTYATVIRDITAEKGWGGLWDGFVPWGVVQAVSKGAVFGMAHATAIRLLSPLTADHGGQLPSMLALTMAGGIAGGVQGYVLSPMLLLKTRVMTNPIFRQKVSAWKTIALSASVGVDLVKTEGIQSLTKGANIFATKRVFDWATRFYFAELIEAFLQYLKSGNILSLFEKSLSSFLGGVLSTVVTLPLDVLVAKSQDAKKAGVKVSALKLFKDELDEKGWSGLSEAYLSGFAVRLLHVCLTVVVMKTLAPVVYQALFG